jgi:hypothetical protein
MADRPLSNAIDLAAKNSEIKTLCAMLEPRPNEKSPLPARPGAGMS